MMIGLIGRIDACGIWGQLFCDYCWDGAFTSGTDSGIANANVFANCTMTKGTSTIYYWGSATTSASSLTAGYFEAPITGTSNLLGQKSAEQSFLSAFFKNGRYTQGQLSDVKLVGCKVTVTNAPACPNLSLNDGSFLTNGAVGNGWTSSNVFLAQYLTTDLADIYIGTGGKRTVSVSATPAVRGKGAPVACPATPPPPPGVKGDPHFTGADNSHFDFTGEPGNNYCLLSDSHVHVNAYYGGRFDRWGDNPHKPLTWIRKLGIMWGEHTITLAAREGARWQYDEGYMSQIEVDGDSVKLNQAGDSASFANGAIEISWMAAKLPSADDLVDVYTVKVAQVLLMRLTLRPEVELLRTAEDGVVHFTVELPTADVSNMAHGVLGQTFRSDRRFKLSKQNLVFDKLLNAEVVPGENAEGFLEGKAADYKASGLLNADCKVARFTGAISRSADELKGVQLTSGEASSVSLSLSRKMLRKVVVN